MYFIMRSESGVKPSAYSSQDHGDFVSVARVHLLYLIKFSGGVEDSENPS
jgi:hypothetical protein